MFSTRDKLSFDYVRLILLRSEFVKERVFSELYYAIGDWYGSNLYNHCFSLPHCETPWDTLIDRLVTMQTWSNRHVR